MAWIVPIPPSARHPQERYQVCYQDGKRHRSAGIFPTKRLALAEKRVIERGDRQPLLDLTDLDPRKAPMPFGEYVTTKVVAGMEGPVPKLGVRYPQEGRKAHPAHLRGHSP